MVDSFSRIVRLGEGVAQTGRSVRRRHRAHHRGAEDLRRAHRARIGVRHVRAIATQAARLAANADVLIARARDEAGIALE